MISLDTRHSTPLLLLLVLVLVLLLPLAYAPSYPGSFVWDDDSALTQNPHMTAPDGLKRIWFSLESIEYYPIYYTSLRFQWRFFGDQPTGYMAVNLALHLLNALLFCAILNRLGIRGAYWGALIFALHPVAVHSAVWINQHKTVLSTTLYLLCALLFVIHLRRRGLILIALSFLFFVAGLLTKPTLVLLPLVFLAMAHVETRTSLAGLCVRLGPWLLIAGLVGCARLFWSPPPMYELAPIRTGDGWMPWAVAGCSIAHSAFKILLPVRLQMIYPRWAIETWAPWTLLPALLLGAAIVWLWWNRRRYPLIWYGILYFVLAMVPVSGLFDNTYFAFSHVANQWLYPAMPGLIPFVPAGLFALADRYPARAVLFQRWIPSVIVIALAGLTAWEAYRYHDPVYYYERGVRENPDNVVAHHNLANLLLVRGDADSALRHYLEAVRIHPVFWQARVEAGKLLAARGDRKEAFDQLMAAHDVFRNNPEVHFHLGVLYGQAGMPEEAARHFETSVSLNYYDPVAWNNLGIAYFQTGEPELAVLAFERSVELNPEYESAIRNLEHAQAALAEHEREEEEE